MPFLIYVVSASASIPFAENNGIARALVLTILLPYYLLAIGTLTLVRGVEKVRLLLLGLLCQFLWWGVQGAFAGGRVPHHPELGNEDAFGPLMVIGMGFCLYYGLGTRQRGLRWLAFGVAALCTTGVVASFARGAVVGAAAVLLYAWLRSPHKARIGAAIILLVGVFLIGTTLLPGTSCRHACTGPSRPAQFWAEMGTIASQGTEAGTGLDRWMLWRSGWKVFLQRPVAGVGAGNFGLFARSNLDVRDLPFGYRASPGVLWGRQLHNVFVQVLAEFGLIGALAFAAMIMDFWRRNAALRSAAFVGAWREATESRIDLRSVSLGLEVAMIAYLVTGLFYDQLYEPWLYSLLTVNALLHTTVGRLVPAHGVSRFTR
jgi:O-antigen ligase